MAQPLGTPLPPAAVLATLDPQLVAPSALPERRFETVGGGFGAGQAGGQRVAGCHLLAGWFVAHWSASSEPYRTSLVGATIGPAATIET